jgi:hypothetical protein
MSAVNVCKKKKKKVRTWPSTERFTGKHDGVPPSLVTQERKTQSTFKVVDTTTLLQYIYPY